MEPASSCENSPPALVVLFFLSLGKTYTAAIHLIAGKTALSSFVSNTPSHSVSLRQSFCSSTSTSCFPVFVRESPAAMVTLIPHRSKTETHQNRTTESDQPYGQPE